MGSYASSETTRTAFIMAAGELFAAKGIDAVSVREIAARAGENTGCIHYHFGNKEGLLNAVVEYAMQNWQNDPFGKFIDDNETLFQSSQGR